MSLLVSDAPLDFRIKSNLVADLLTLAGEPIENIRTYVYTVQYNLGYPNLHYPNPRLSERIEIPKDSSNFYKTM